MESLKIIFDGTRSRLSLTERVDSYLNEMQTAVVNTVTPRGDKDNIDPLQGTFLVAEARGGVLFDESSAAAASNSAALFTAFYMDQLEQDTETGVEPRPEKISLYELTPAEYTERGIVLNANFDFEDGTSSRFPATI